MCLAASFFLFWIGTETDFCRGCSELYWLLVCLSPALGKHWALLDRLIVLDLPAHNPGLSKRNSHARRKKAMNACIPWRNAWDFPDVPGTMMSWRWFQLLWFSMSRRGERQINIYHKLTSYNCKCHKGQMWASRPRLACSQWHLSRDLKERLGKG